MRRLLDNLCDATSVSLIWIALAFLLVPVIVVLGLSFDARDFLGSFPPTAFSAKWYRAVFSSSILIDSARLSLLIATLAAIISTIIGVAAAIALDRYDFPGRGLIASLMLSPLVVPGVVLGFGLLLLFSYAGVTNGFTRLLCGHVIITMPYTIRTTLAGLVGIKKSYIEAAVILGATERQAFFDIVLPLARTGIVAGAIFAFAFSLDDVAVSVFLADTGHMTLPVALISLMRASFDMSIAAVAVLVLLFTVVLVVVLDRAVGMDRIIGQGIYRS